MKIPSTNQILKQNWASPYRIWFSSLKWSPLTPGSSELPTRPARRSITISRLGGSVQKCKDRRHRLSRAAGMPSALIVTLIGPADQHLSPTRWHVEACPDRHPPGGMWRPALIVTLIGPAGQHLSPTRWHVEACPDRHPPGGMWRPALTVTLIGPAGQHLSPTSPPAIDKCQRRCLFLAVRKKTSHSAVTSIVLPVQVRSGLIDLLLVTCNPVLPASGSGSRRLNRHPHHLSQGRL